MAEPSKDKDLTRGSSIEKYLSQTFINVISVMLNKNMLK